MNKRFVQISALQKYIRRGYAKNVIRLRDEMETNAFFRNRFQVTLVEDIGPAAAEFVAERILDPDFSDETITKACNLKKSRIGAYFPIFYRISRTIPSDIEPFAYESEIDFTDIVKASHYCGIMFLKDMDVLFCRHLLNFLPADTYIYKLANLLARTSDQDIVLAKTMRSNNGIYAMILSMLTFCAYANVTGLEIEEEYAAMENELMFEEYPDFVFDKHTSRGRAEGKGYTDFFIESVKLNAVNSSLEQLEKFYKLMTIDYYVGTATIPRKLIEGKKIGRKQFHISKTGISTNQIFRPRKTKSTNVASKYFTLPTGQVAQIPMLNITGNRVYSFVYWDGGNKYFTKPFASKERCDAAVKVNNQLHELSARLVDREVIPNIWCAEAKVITRPFAPIKKRVGEFNQTSTYWFVQPAFEYVFPITTAISTWKKHQCRDEVVLVNLAKYIIGIGDRTARNVGMSLYRGEDSHLSMQVISFDHDPVLNGNYGKVNGKLGRIVKPKHFDEFITTAEEYARDVKLMLDRVADVRNFFQ